MRSVPIFRGPRGEPEGEPEGGERRMEEQDDQKDGVGDADLVSKLYIAFGVPSIIMFMVVLFALTRWFGIPA